MPPLERRVSHCLPFHVVFPSVWNGKMTQANFRQSFTRLALHWFHPGLDTSPVFMVVVSSGEPYGSCFPPCLVLHASLTSFTLSLVGGRALHLRSRPGLIDMIKQPRPAPLMSALTAVSAHRCLMNARL